MFVLDPSGTGPAADGLVQGAGDRRLGLDRAGDLHRGGRHRWRSPAASRAGCSRRRTLLERWMLLVAGVLLVYPKALFDAIGFVLVAMVLVGAMVARNMRLDTDILILGSGGAGLFAALHAHKAAPELSITVAVKGLLGKCGCTRMVQGGYNVALAREDSIERHFMDTIEGGKWLPDQELAWKLVVLAIERIKELENELGLLLRPQSRRHRPPEGVRRPDVRPHRAQGRPDRHRDHQPARRAGVGAQDRTAGGASGGRADQRLRPEQPSRACSSSTCAPANTSSCARRRCCSRPAAGRRCTATTRPRATRAATAWRWRCAPDCRCATWRWCSSIPPACLPARIRA